jgi:hypothetical protein
MTAAMTVSETPGNWAEGEHDPPVGPLVVDMPPPRGVFLSDLPADRPAYTRPHVKGVPGASTSADEDHQPGGGAWRPA